MLCHKKTLYLFLLLSVAVFASAPSQAGIDNMASAINKAGRQRMLTQRIVKAYCQIGLDVRAEEARVQLDKAML